MHISKTKALTKEINELSTNRGYYAILHSFLYDFMQGTPVISSSFIDEFNKKRADLTGEDRDNALKFDFLDSILSKGIDRVPSYYYTKFLRYTYDNFKFIDSVDIKNNSYFKDIEISYKSCGNFTLDHAMNKQYECVTHGTPDLIANSGEYMSIEKIACYKDEFYCPAIFEDDNVNCLWMSITPNEIGTMQKDIDNARGKVLTFGLGLGYYAYMVSLKDDVESITIIEHNQDAIDLFNNEILPQFKHKDKIKVIKADAYEYMLNLKDKQYDYCFVDIWYGSDDIIPYLKMKKLGQHFKKMRVSYWIEDSFLVAISSILLDLIIKNIKGTTSTSLTNLDLYIKKIYKKTNIENVNQLYSLLDIKNINKMLSTTKVDINDFIV